MSYAEICNDEIIYDGGTQIIVRHNDFDYDIQVDASGQGDFYSHVFEVTEIEKI